MIQAYLLTPTGLKKNVVQTGDQIVIEKERLWLSENEVAVHKRRAWRMGSTSFIVFKINSPVEVHFEGDQDQTPMAGPFNELWLVNGMILSNLNQEYPLAKFDFDSKKWITPPETVKWSKVVFKAVSSEGG